MADRVKRVPYVKFTDPQIQKGDSGIPGRAYTGLLWGFLFAACMALCLYYCMVKPIVISSANVSDDELIDLTRAVTLTANPIETPGTVIFSVPAGVRASDIVTENLYNERRFLVHINTDTEDYYGSVSESGISVDSGRISGDPSLVLRSGVAYDKTGALLIFDMSGVYEYVLSIDEDRVIMEAVKPSDMYDFVAVLDPEDSFSAAGVSTDVAERCAELLSAGGVKVYITEPGVIGDGYVTPAELTDETCADIFIKLGVSHDGPDSHGIRTYYDPLYYIPGYGSIQLCESCLKNTAIAVSDKALGITEAPEGSVSYDINVPAVHITLGNSDNSRENELLTDDSYRDRLAKGLMQAVLEAKEKMGEETWRD